MKKNLLFIIKLFFILLILFFGRATNLNAQGAAVTFQSNVICTYPGDVNVPVIIVKISVANIPYNLFALFLSTSGSNNASVDIDSARVFYTGNSNAFSSSNPYGAPVAGPNGFFQAGAGPSFPLLLGDNYFWVMYDIKSTALINDTLDAVCTSIYGSTGTITPSVTTPPGNIIIGCTTSIQDQSSMTDVTIFMDPVSENIQLVFNKDNTAKVTVYDALGRNVIFKLNVNGSSAIDFKEQPHGIYFAEAVTGQGRFYKKIIKK